MTKTVDTTNMTPENAARLVKLAEEKAKAVFKKIPLIGPIAWLMMQQGPTRHAFIADIEWRILPALLLDQAKLYLKDEVPLGFVSWAKLSDDVAARYKRVPHQLAPADWKSGEQLWIIDLVAPFGNAREILKDLNENVFPGQTLYQLAPAQDAQTAVIEWGGTNSKD